MEQMKLFISMVPKNEYYRMQHKYFTLTSLKIGINLNIFVFKFVFFFFVRDARYCILDVENISILMLLLP